MNYALAICMTPQLSDAQVVFWNPNVVRHGRKPVLFQVAVALKAVLAAVALKVVRVLMVQSVMVIVCGMGCAVELTQILMVYGVPRPIIAQVQLIIATITAMIGYFPIQNAQNTSEVFYEKQKWL